MSSNNKTRIIIADAEEKFRYLLAEELSTEDDFDVIGITGNGIEAFDMAKVLKGDVMIIDLLLFGCDGLSLMRKLAELPAKKRPAVIVVSAFLNERSAIEMANLGVSYFLLKPCDMRTLIARIRMVIGKPRQIWVIRESQQQGADETLLILNTATTPNGSPPTQTLPAR